MKVVALVSGGKDSCYAMMKCIQYGHEIVALANLLPVDDSVDELDSYMYQTVGHQIIVSYADCMGLPLFRRRIQGSTRHQQLSYQRTPNDEVEDMFILLSEVKRQIPSITAVSSGAIASDYQRLRVESICSRLGLVSLAYLWKQDQALLLREMIANGIKAILVKVAAIGLDPAKHLGKEISFMEPYLLKLKELYGINVCGEGGEYETLTLDCPLFVNARISLDEFQVVLHSPDSIAPVGVLHPSTLHLENKNKSEFNPSTNKLGLVVEVQGECQQISEIGHQPDGEVSDLVQPAADRLCISKTEKENAFSICCWLEDSCGSSAGLQEDLEIVLKEIESQFLKHGLGWQHVLYIHLYISDMGEFATANESYVKFITQEKCPFGVPSRSTIELPLVQAGLGRAYVEVLVVNDQSKNVLHVQSISCWAPSCIGPYSQSLGMEAATKVSANSREDLLEDMHRRFAHAHHLMNQFLYSETTVEIKATLHKGVLHMAGQLGLDPPTMSLCKEGATAELEQALTNSEAISEAFKCSISSSAVLFVVFCSARITQSERCELHDKFVTFLDQLRPSRQDNRRTPAVLDPMFLYVLVPDLPKRALVEVKPILYVAEDTEPLDETKEVQSCLSECSYWGYKPEKWHNDCLQQRVLDGRICAAVVSVSAEVVKKVCPQPHSANEEEQLETVSRFCIYLLNKVLKESSFSWQDTTNLRIHFSTSLGVATKRLSDIFIGAFREFAEMNRSITATTEPIFNLIPVLGSGNSSASMDNLIACELFARRW